ncbi:general secretion pathway protein GspN [Luteimonas sp. MC1750]|uniref:general secretion pathway protein GspN n=1 Tax=Luteimonas sp. MC1750 TaxID=2799326 RepID=UPI0018F0F7C1|nr:general secretion pathway protein GspN [Luteimonas sp. MC1750]MBJ6983249.1 general secretion pathway protein GspN [Luteimonas sp. MC1750]QQO05487.1 general secretion pathway protein GspN [Luteimonas sp. MC1750]
MRAESAGARTWLLGALALWALATWVLGLFGLGGRIERLPPDPALVQGLPAAARETEDRLGPLAQYAEFGERPLFTTDRRPELFVINPVDEEAPAEFEYVLTSVLMTPGLQVAIVQPAAGGEPVRLKVGESPAGVQGWQLSSISPRGAVFDGPEGQRTLELRVFDGTGGEAPTAIASPQAPGQVPARPEATPARRASASAQPAAPGARAADAAGSPADPAGGGIAGAGEQPSSETPPPPPSADGGTQAPPPAPPPDTPTARSSDEQVQAIRARIEARRARLREQAQQGQ